MLAILRVKQHGVAMERRFETVTLVIRQVELHIEANSGPSGS
jgi:hypothetical protein